MNTVSVVDPDSTLGPRLRQTIDGSGRYVCVSTYWDLTVARRGLLIDQPDIVIFEPRYPNEAGIEWIRSLKPRMAKTEFLAFTRHYDAKTIFNSVSAGATGFLCKRSNPEQLISALDDLCAGGSPLSASVARVVLEAISGDRRTPMPFPSTLTRRESEVLAEIVRGCMLKEINATLGISPGTLNTHMRKLYRKLGVNSRSEIMARYFSTNLRSYNPLQALPPVSSPGEFHLKRDLERRIV
jgi:DNA-binding NarL/FixJ family response regulator